MRVEPLRELASEPCTRVDLVHLDVAKRISRNVRTGSFQLGQDRVQARTLGDEEVDRADPIHGFLEPQRFPVEIENGLGNVHAVHVPGLPTEPDLG